VNDNPLDRLYAYARRIASELSASGASAPMVGTFGGEGRAGWLVAPFDRVDGTDTHDGYEWRSETSVFLGPDGRLFFVEHHWDTARTNLPDRIYESGAGILLEFDKNWGRKNSKVGSRRIEQEGYPRGRTWSGEDYVGISKKLSAIRPSVPRIPSASKPVRSTVPGRPRVPEEASPIGRWVRVRQGGVTTIVALTRAGAAFEKPTFSEPIATAVGAAWAKVDGKVTVDLTGGSVVLRTMLPNEMTDDSDSQSERWYRLASETHRPHD
jgi:hypothetical protein